MSALLNGYIPVFQLGIHFALHSAEEDCFEKFRQRCLSALEIAEKETAAIYPSDEVKASQFAVVVWLDEIVSGASPVWLKEWRSDLLQTRLFNTSIGGSEFFSRLAAIDPENLPLRQVYLFCLLMGFKGQYASVEPALLQEKIEDERRCLPPAWQQWPNSTRIVAMKPDLESHKHRFPQKRHAIKLTLLLVSMVSVYLALIANGYYFLNGN